MARLSKMVQALLVVGAAWFACAPCPTGAGDESAERNEAAKTVRAMLPDLRTAAAKDRDTLAKLKEAKKLLEPFAADVRKAYWNRQTLPLSARFARAWNELLTVAEYHRSNLRGDYEKK